MKTGKTKEEVKQIGNALFDSLKEVMGEGHDVFIRKFGTFATKAGKPTGRNIATNTMIHLAPYKVVKFKPSPEFKEMVK